MTKTPMAPPQSLRPGRPKKAQLTLFDIPEFDVPASLEGPRYAKSPSSPNVTSPKFEGPKFEGPQFEAVRARRHRSLARLAKRRYLADSESYLRIEQVRSSLRLVISQTGQVDTGQLGTERRGTGQAD